MDIKGKITGIKYKVSLAETLKIVDIKNFNINESPAFVIVKDNSNFFTVSKWVSPKRTRSYPYERVYNTLNSSKKITVIPIVKDGLLKMILYSNLCEVEVDGKKMKSQAVLNLTSPKITVGVTSEYPIWDRPVFLLNDNLSQEKIRFIDALLDEAVENGFVVKITNYKIN